MESSIKGPSTRKRSRTETTSVVDLTNRAASATSPEEYDSDDVCVIDPPVVTPIKSLPSSHTDDNDVQVTGTVNTLSLPHIRAHCDVNPFRDMGNGCLSDADMERNRKTCSLCYCYVCDLPAKDCSDWRSSHCNATDEGPSASDWTAQRMRKRQNIPEDGFLFEGSLTRGQIFKNVMNRVRNLESEVVLDFSPDGIGLKCLDASLICFISFHLPSADFDNFTCSSPVGLRIDVKHTTKLLAGIKKAADSLTIRATSSSISFQINSSEPLGMWADVDNEDQFDYPAGTNRRVWNLPSTKLRDVINLLTNVGDKCTFSWCPAEPTTIAIAAKASGMMRDGAISRAAFRYKEGVVQEGFKECDRKSKVVYNLDFKLRFVSLCLKGAQISRDVSVALVPDFPLSIEYHFGSNGGYLRYMVARLVEEH